MIVYDRHTLDIFFTGIYGFAAFWLILFVILTTPRPNKNYEDYAVIGFRAATGFVCLMVFLRRFMEWDPIVILPAMIVFAWTAMMNTFTVISHLRREKNDAGPGKATH